MVNEKVVESAIPFNTAKTLEKGKRGFGRKNRELGGRDIPSLHLGLRGCWFLGLHLRNCLNVMTAQ